MSSDATSRYGAPWSRDELILALYLYCQIPFAQATAKNPEVKRLAELLGRTPASVSRKLGNLGTFDPSLRVRGVTGLTHFAKADRDVWEEFEGRWSALVDETRHLLSAKGRTTGASSDAEAPAPEWIVPPLGTPTERHRMAPTRLRQAFFRRTVLASYRTACCVCGLDLASLLTASHIIPWAAKEETRTDPRNGLCLCALHDRAFDAGLLGVDSSFNVRISATVRSSAARVTGTVLLQFDGQGIAQPERFAPAADYLQWRWENVFLP